MTFIVLAICLCSCAARPPKDTGLTEPASFYELNYWISPDWMDVSSRFSADAPGMDEATYSYLCGGESCIIRITSTDTEYMEGNDFQEKFNNYMNGIPLNRHGNRKFNDDGTWNVTYDEGDGIAVAKYIPLPDRVFQIVTSIPAGNAAAQEMWENFSKYVKW